jgi:hypothetical protein
MRKTAEGEFRWNEFSWRRLIRKGVGSTRLPTFENPARESGVDFKLDQLLENLVEFFVEVGDEI